MNAKMVRSLATDHATDALNAAIEGIIEREEDVLGIGEEDLEELLTNLMLASRVRAAVDDEGVSLKDAFRAEMAKVRKVVQNTPND